MSGWQWVAVIIGGLACGVAGFFIAVYYIGRGMFRDL